MWCHTKPVVLVPVSLPTIIKGVSAMQLHWLVVVLAMPFALTPVLATPTHACSSPSPHLFPLKSTYVHLCWFASACLHSHTPALATEVMVVQYNPLWLDFGGRVSSGGGHRSRGPHPAGLCTVPKIKPLWLDFSAVWLAVMDVGAVCSYTLVQRACTEAEMVQLQ
jgi:hypothetical protein